MAMTSGIRTSWIRAVTSCVKDIATTRSLSGGPATVQGLQNAGSDGSSAATTALNGHRPFSRRSRPSSRLEQVENSPSGSVELA